MSGGFVASWLRGFVASWLRCIARKTEIIASRPIGRPCKLDDDQENEVIKMTLAAAKDLMFLTKHEVLDEIENRDGKILTYGWLYDFMLRHQNQIACVTVYRQENPCLQIPRLFLDQYFALVQEHVIGINYRLVDNYDEKQYSDWEERGRYDGLVPAAMKNNQIHLTVTRKIKYQTMLVCINAAGETLYPFFAMTNRLILGFFRD
jgi:hypothetical protein